MPLIRIKETPPGFAPLDIRKRWIGIEIPLATDEELAANPPGGFKIGNDNEGGYTVLAHKGIEALKKARQFQAAIYWRSVAHGSYLVFRKDVCELIP